VIVSPSFDNGGFHPNSRAENLTLRLTAAARMRVKLA